MQTTGKVCSSTACYYRYLLQNREHKEELSSVNKFIHIINRILQYICILNTEFSAYEFTFRCGNKFSCILYIYLAASTILAGRQRK